MEATARSWKVAWRDDDQHGSIYFMPREGHAHAIAVKPRYVKRKEWEANADLIVHSVNNIDRITAERDGLKKALEDLLEDQETVSGCDCSTCAAIINARAALAVSDADGDRG